MLTHRRPFFAVGPGPLAPRSLRAFLQGERWSDTAGGLSWVWKLARGEIPRLRPALLLRPVRFRDRDRRVEALRPIRSARRGGRCLNRLHDVHPRDDAAEHRESLSVGVALAAVIHLRLIADDDRERSGGAVGPVACHRNG